MRSCLRVSSTKEEIKIMVNAATDFDEVLAMKKAAYKMVRHLLGYRNRDI